MKKIIVSIFSAIILLGCSIIPSNVIVRNSQINDRADKFINISKNIIVANINIRNIYTRAKGGYIYSDLKYNYKVLGGAVASNYGTVSLRTELEVKKNKLYLKNPEVIKITAENGLEENQKVANVITNTILNTLTLQELYDFKNDFYVKDVKILDNHIVLEVE